MCLTISDGSRKERKVLAVTKYADYCLEISPSSCNDRVQALSSPTLASLCRSRQICSAQSNALKLIPSFGHLYDTGSILYRSRVQLTNILSSSSIGHM